jgi:dihydrolipoamide dehydrogenase
MDKNVDVAIIGAGTAGLFAAREVRKVTKNFLLLDPGPFGTTCARVACMPSKILIQAANDFHRRRALRIQGIIGEEQLSVQIPEVLKHVRKLRDHYVKSVMKVINDYRDNFMQERAFFLEAGVLKAGDNIIRARKIIIATGSTPRMLPDSHALGAKLVTSDEIFELEDLPQNICVIGKGAVGVELGQALSRLGLKVHGFHSNTGLGGLTDPVVQAEALSILSNEYRIHTNKKVTLKNLGEHLNVIAGNQSYASDMVLASIGRKPNLDSLQLENTGAELDSRGVPLFDPRTMQLNDLPIFIAGDANAERGVVPEAADEGRIAGFNSVREEVHCFQRRTPLAIAFTSPNIASAGKLFADLQSNEIAIGEINFSDQGRSVIQQENAGILRIYADKRTGVLLGAEMIAPAGEHLAHLIALSIQRKLTVFDLLKMPFYHPVFEQGLRTALRDLSQKVELKVPDFELAFCEFPDLGLY